MNKKILGLALAATFATGSAQALVIDDFNTGALSVAANGSVLMAYAGGVSNDRLVTINKASTGPGGPLNASSAILTPPGIYTHSADALTSAISSILWDNNGAGLGGVDLTEGLLGNTFNLDILSIDQGNVGLAISVVDTLGGADTVTALNLGAGIEQIAFSSFAGIDFTSIQSISLIVSGGNASDLTLDSLGTSGITPPAPAVPEPTALALLGMGLAAFGFGRRKAK